MCTVIGTMFLPYIRSIQHKQACLSRRIAGFHPSLRMSSGFSNTFMVPRCLEKHMANEKIQDLQHVLMICRPIQFRMFGNYSLQAPQMGYYSHTLLPITDKLSNPMNTQLGSEAPH